MGALGTNGLIWLLWIDSMCFCNFLSSLWNPSVCILTVAFTRVSETLGVSSKWSWSNKTSSVILSASCCVSGTSAVYFSFVSYETILLVSLQMKETDLIKFLFTDCSINSTAVSLPYSYNILLNISG